MTGNLQEGWNRSNLKHFLAAAACLVPLAVQLTAIIRSKATLAHRFSSSGTTM
jgi:hypothetical protein